MGADGDARAVAPRKAVVTALGAALGAIAVLAGCGRLGFGEPELTFEPGLVTGVYTADANLCLSRGADVQFAITTKPWPTDWAAEDFEALSSGAGVIKAGVTRGHFGCKTVTVPVAQEGSEVYLYAVAGEGVEKLVGEDSDKMHPAFELRTLMVRSNPAYPSGYLAHYWLHFPEEYYRDPGAGRPTLLFLHGFGGNGSNSGENINYVRDTEEVPRLYQTRSPVVSAQPFIVVAPQCNADRNGNGCFGWSGATIMPFLDEVLADARAQAPVDDHRFYVAGESTGGEGAWRYAIHQPELVSAIISVANTYKPNDPTDDYFGGAICKMSRVAVWAFHNGTDSSQPPSNSQNLVTRLKACPAQEEPQLDLGNWTFQGGTHAGWIEVYGGTHGFSNDGVSSVYDWLLAHSR